MIARYLFFIVIVSALSACSDERHPVDGDHVWKEQTDMIDKAKQAEQVVIDSALQQKKQIEQNLD